MPSRLTLLILAAAVGSACGTKPPVSGPLGPEICNNKTDDNGDGKVDCADPKCFQDAACRGMTERCDNDIDDNGDGLIDCADPLCAGQSCGTSCTCIGGVKVMGNTGGGSGGANGGGAGGSSGGGTGGSSGGGTGGSSGGGTGGSSGGGTGGSGGGGTGGSGGGMSSNGGGTGGSSGGGTGGSSGGGTGGSSGGGTGGSSGGGTGGSSGGGTGGASGGGTGGATGGGTGGASGGGTGGGGVAHEMNCADNIDNDGDNLTDCDDPDCVGLTCGMGCTCVLNRKTEVNCSDGADNDGDGKADCLDSDCVGAGAEICGDGIDNNCDNAIDCGDAKCTGSGLCSGLQDAKPCLLDTQCAGGKCYTEALTGTPNGACGNSVSCTVGTANVGCNGGTCVAGSTFNTCYAKCTGTGISGTGACRAGYLCIDADTILSNNNNYCMPSCSSSAECLNQGGVYGCNPWNKRCGTIDRGRGKYGAACTLGSDCEGGVCYLGPSFPSGYCGGYCRGDTLNCATGGICNFDSSYGDNLGICYESCTASAQCRTLDRYHCFGPTSNPVGTCLCISAGLSAAGLGSNYCCSGSWNASSVCN